MIRTVLAVLALSLLAPRAASAQAESSVEARVGLALATGLAAGLGTWVAATPHGGFWADEIRMEAPRPGSARSRWRARPAR
ncbi:MAG TPA: hypothetical protein RMH99_09590 [Sandaracinaceae bacterium LLY-WYZ-13_1]|nr:hypothetical protein [Sandaracinaceae bacterium LLY-WYZ-13_1]